MFYHKDHTSEFLYFSKMLERLFTGIKTHRLFSEHLLHLAEAPNDVGDDALKAADGVYWKKL